MSIRLTITNWLLRTIERPALAKIDEPAVAQKRLLDQSKNFRAPPGVTFGETSLCYGDRELEALVATPKISRPRAALLYFHGGAYSIGSPQTHKYLAGRIGSGCELQTFLPRYRVATAAKFPAAYEDAMTSYRALIDRGFNKIAIAGDSAGGGLAFALLHGICTSDLPKPFAMVGLCPWTDLTLSSPSLKENDTSEVMLPVERFPEMVERYLGDQNPLDPRASPVFGIFEDAPASLIQVSQKEVLFDDALRLAARLEEFGVETKVQTWDNTFHVWHSLQGKIPEATDAVKDVAAFIDAQFTKVTR